MLDQSNITNQKILEQSNIKRQKTTNGYIEINKDTDYESLQNILPNKRNKVSNIELLNDFIKRLGFTLSVDETLLNKFIEERNITEDDMNLIYKNIKIYKDEEFKDLNDILDRDYIIYNNKESNILFNKTASDEKELYGIEKQYNILMKTVVATVIIMEGNLSGYLLMGLLCIEREHYKNAERVLLIYIENEVESNKLYIGKAYYNLCILHNNNYLENSDIQQGKTYCYMASECGYSKAKYALGLIAK